MPISLVNFLICREFAKNQGVADPDSVNRVAVPAAVLPNLAVGVGVTQVLAQQAADSQPPPAGRGEDVVEVPNAIFKDHCGTRLTFDKASEVLKQSQFSPTRQATFSVDHEKDLVIDQDPRPPGPARLGSTVRLLVSDGPPPAQGGDQGEVVKLEEKVDRVATAQNALNALKTDFDSKFDKLDNKVEAGFAAIESHLKNLAVVQPPPTQS